MALTLQVQNSRALLAVALFAAFAISFTACVGGIGNSSNTSALNYSNSMSVVQKNIQTGAQNVPLNTTIEITVDQEIEEYFPSMELNFSLTRDGNPIAGKLSAELVPHPQSPTTPVSKIIFTPNRALFPNATYKFRWRAAPQAGDQLANELRGIMSRKGNPPAQMPMGGIEFTTGNTFINKPNNAGLVVLDMSPGRMLSSTFTGTLTDALTDIITPSANPSIKLQFSEPIAHASVDSVLPYSQEIPWTNLCGASSTPGCFGGMTIFTFSASNLTGNVVQEIDAALSNQSAWFSYLSSHYQSILPGKVRTTSGRRVLEYQTYPGVQYPDNLAQAIIVVVNDLKSADSYAGVPPRVLVNGGFAVGGFIHFSGFTWPSGFMDVNVPMGGQ